ncbi:MAG TPA: hypothetical protein ENK18_09220 [Deltaproteobacteria bacterium]|nr:hypothetical protein [Deltaproteobacteria bacterium]
MLTTLLAFAACKAPPPAPEGLDDSVQHLYRGFYDSDAEIGAGLTGLMDWFDAEGVELLDQRAALDSVGAFSLAALTREDIAGLAFDGDPDPSLASGVVALAEMGCDWKRAEQLLIRPDQHVVFEGDFDVYDRTFVTARGVYEDASETESFDPIDELLPAEALADYPGTLMLTENATSSTDLGVTLPFDINLHFRHGEFEVQGEMLNAFLILSWAPAVATSDGGNTSLRQSWGIEANLQRPGDKTLRVFASWVELDSTFVDSDSAVVKTSAVNKAQDSAERLSGICTGDIVL